MKKILTILALAALPCAVFAQGRVNFSNPNTALLRTNLTTVGGTAGSADFTFTPLRVGLYIAPAGSTLDSQFSLASLDVVGSPALATNRSGAFRGLFNGGNPFTLAGNNGTPAAFQLRAWTASYATYAAARVDWLAGVPGVLIGTSAIVDATPATGATPTTTIVGVGAGLIGGFDVVPGVPEPSSIALGLLGLGAVAFFRRRK